MDSCENSKVFRTATRPQVCVHCRRLKVKCRSDPHNKSGKCQRCLKAGRNCVTYIDLQKQQGLQRDYHIIRLEEKVDALTSAFNNATPCACHESFSKLTPTTSSSSSWESTHGEEAVRQSLIRENGLLHRSERVRHANEGELETSHPAEALSHHTDHETGPVLSQPLVYSLNGTLYPQSIESTQTSPSTTPPGQTSKSFHLEFHPEADVVGQGKLSMQTASLILSYYVEHMAPHMPVVVFPPWVDVLSLRLTKPLLFLAVLTVGSGGLYPDLHELLNKIILKVLLDRVITHGEKSVEIVQALTVYSTWYPAPPKAEQLAVQQLLAITATVADYIVRAKFFPASETALGLLEWSCEDEDWILQFTRAWLGCFIICSKSSIRWLGPSLIRWLSFGPACIEALETVPNPLESDLMLCKMARYQHVAETVTMQRPTSDCIAGLSMENGQLFESLEQRFSDSDYTAHNFTQSSLILYREATNMYLHEPILHTGYEQILFRAPYAIEKLSQLELRRALTDKELEGLETCISSAQRWINVFQSLEVSVLRALPGLYFIDAVYAVIILVSAAFTLADSRSLDRFVFFQTIQLDSSVHKIQDTFNTAAKDQKCLPANRVCSIFSKIQEQILEHVAAPVMSIPELYQSKPFMESRECGFEQEYRWPEAWPLEAITGDFATFNELGDLDNIEIFPHFPITSRFSQDNNSIAHLSLRGKVTRSRDINGNLLRDFEIGGRSEQFENCGKSDRDFQLEGEASVDTGTALSLQADWDIPIDVI